MTNYKFDAHLKFDIDLDLCYSDEYFDRYKYLQGKVSQVLHIVDIRNGKPVKWIKGFKFNRDKHSLTKFFDKEIIELYPHNKQITIAYCENGVATIKLYLAKKYSWRTEIEKRFLAIISNLIFNKVRSVVSQVLRNRNRQSEILTKNELYNLLLVLNSKLTSPLDENLVNKLTTYIWLKFVNDELTPPIEVKKSIRAKSFMDEFVDNYPECKYYTLQKAVRVEVNRIKAACRRQKYDKIITTFRKKHPDSSYTDIVKMLCDKHKLGKSNASKIYCEWKKVSSPTSLDNKNKLDKISDDTFSSIFKMEQFIYTYNKEEKPTQKVVASGSGVSIAQVKRNWSHFKKEVNKIKRRMKKK